MTVYARKWFPGREISEESLAEAAYLEWDYWKKLGETLNRAMGG